MAPTEDDLVLREILAELRIPSPEDGRTGRSRALQPRAGLTIPLLRAFQQRLGFVPVQAIPEVARALGVPASELYSVASFYPAFTLSDTQGTGRNRRTEQRMAAAFSVHFDPVQVRESAGYPGQTRRALARCGAMDACAIEDFLTGDGYKGLEKAQGMSPGEVIAAIRSSGLRGAGGAGFPTWIKWQAAANSPADERYIVCNAAEGDLGAFGDRVILEGDPHAILEGMAIAAHAIGATKGYIYIRSEYESSVGVMENAIRQARSRGVLGGGTDGAGKLAVDVFQAAGMYICGEETALLNSMEGKPGRPRSRPPFPVQSGLWGRPTVVNNVKTLAHVAWILRHGAEEFARLGTEKSKGTVVLSVCGPVARPGVLEVPMGTPLRQVIFGICGGVRGGGRLKAVQTGGPLGGILPEAMLDTPLSFEHMAGVGSPLGSGGMIVFPEGTCMVSVARHFRAVAQEESCGHCAPCRLGTLQLEKILADWVSGQGRETDFELVAAVTDAMKSASFCAFGQGAPGVLLSALRHFQGEFEEHARLGKCPAGTCPMAGF